MKAPSQLPLQILGEDGERVYCRAWREADDDHGDLKQRWQ
jgi:hypothetical protein